MHKSYLIPVLLMASLTARSTAQNQNEATSIENISAKDGFKVELLYTVPKEKFGSWVNLCVDDKNRIIASDQFGGLYRFSAPKEGKNLDESSIEKIPAEIRAANGLLWAFDALYVAVNDYEKKMESGVYKLTDSNGDDQLDKVEKLRGMQARGDHGVHALILSPDKKSIYLITGNNTTPTEPKPHAFPDNGVRIIPSPECPMVGVTTVADWLPRGSFTRCRPMAKTGKSSLRATATFSTVASTWMATFSLMTQTWNMISIPHGTAPPESVTSQAARCTDGATERASGPSSTPTLCPLSQTSDPVRPPA